MSVSRSIDQVGLIALLIAPRHFSQYPCLSGETDV
jgi:hypothetical protein